MSQNCPVCGLAFGVTHACSGIVTEKDPTKWIAPSGLAPAYYIRLSLAVARLDGDAIDQCSQDKSVLKYAFLFFFLLMLAVSTFGYFRSASLNPKLSPIQFIAGSLIGVTLLILHSLIQYGICHFLAKWKFSAQGTYVGVIRAMFLGLWVISLPGVIPFVGVLISGLWGIALLMRVFEEVEKIERMQAFALAFGVGLGLNVLTYYLVSA